LSSKTNAIRLLERAGIAYKEAFYSYDPDDLNGMHAAEGIGLPPEQVFKTLVTKGTKTGYHVFCIPVCKELDLKKAAKAASDKAVVMLPVKELQSVTGYIRGGCSPVGMKKVYPVHLDVSSRSFQEIAVSAGERGHQILLSPDDLINMLHGDYFDLTQ